MDQLYGRENAIGRVELERSHKTKDGVGVHSDFKGLDPFNGLSLAHLSFKGVGFRD